MNKAPESIKIDINSLKKIYDVACELLEELSLMYFQGKDIGEYNTCPHLCAYCYANYSSKSVETNATKYDPSSPLLCGQVQEDDKITIRKVESLKETQLSIFDI